MRVTCPSSRPWNFRCTGRKSVAIRFHCKALQSASCQSAPSCCSGPFGGCCRGCIKVASFFSLGCSPANFGHQHLCLSLLQHSVPVDVHALYYGVQSFNADKFALLETRLLCWVQSHSDHFELVCSPIV